MAQNFFDTYQQQSERRKKAQGPSIAEPIPALDRAMSAGVQKRALRQQPQFQPIKPDPQYGGWGQNISPDAYTSQPSIGTELGPTADIAHKGHIGGPLAALGQEALTGGGIMGKQFHGFDKWAFGPGDQGASGGATSPAPAQPSVTSTGGGAAMAKPPGAQPGSQVPAQSSPIPNLPQGAVGWKGTPGWGPKQTPQQAQEFYDKALSSGQELERVREANMPSPSFQPPEPESAPDARSMGMGPFQQEVMNQSTAARNEQAVNSAYARWLQGQELGMQRSAQEGAMQKNRLDTALGASQLQTDEAKRAQMPKDFGIDQANALEKRMQGMSRMTINPTTGKAVPNPEYVQLEQAYNKAMGIESGPSTAPTATTASPESVDQPTSFWDKAHAFGRQAATAAGAAATPGVLAKMGVKSAGRGVLGPLAYGGLAYSGLNMLADVLDPEGSKAVGRNPKSGFAGSLTGGVGGYKFGPRPGVATPTEAGPPATPPLAQTGETSAGVGAGEAHAPWEYAGGEPTPQTASAAAPTSSTMSGTKAPVSEAGQQGIRALKPGEPLPGTALGASDATMRQKFRDAPAMEAEPVVYTPEDQQAIETVRAVMGEALHRGDMDTFQRLWVQLEALHNKYKGASPSPLH